MVLLAMINTKYRFLLVDVVSSKFSQVALIFKHCMLNDKIENANMGLPVPEPLGEAGPDLHYFLLADDL